MKNAGLLMSMAMAWFLAGPPALSADEEGSGREVELVYIETNIDASAGGHLALRIAKQVYHYQAVGRRLLLVREPWAQFRHFYQRLENRGLRVATLDLDAQQRFAVESHLNRQLIVQQRHLRTERLLWLESDWYALGAGDTGELKLPGLGYFASIARAANAGPGSLDNLSLQLDAVRNELALLEPASPRLALDVSRGHIGAVPADSLEQRESLLQLYAALSIIQSDTDLHPENLVYLEQSQLTNRERQLLTQYRLVLEASTQRLLDGTRADRGYPLLINRARRLAVDQSLRRGHWVFLNSFPQFSQGISGDSNSREAEVFRQLRRQLEHTWQIVRHAETDSDSLDMQAYSRLETAASRVYVSTRGGLSHGTVEAWRSALLMPQRPGALWLESSLMAGDVSDALGLASKYSIAVSRAYEYRLLSQNCVTQLVQALNQGAEDAGDVEEVLGARLEAGEGLDFIPRLLFEEALATLRVSGERYLPSRREQTIAAMHLKQSAWQVDLRESNVWTSRAYSGSIRDDAFLFFTDGSVWLRPLQGIANVGYAAVNGSLGLLSAPFDRGERLSDGLRGMFYSAPELLFINLRKGQYDTLPTRQAGYSLDWEN